MSVPALGGWKQELPSWWGFQRPIWVLGEQTVGWGESRTRHTSEGWGGVCLLWDKGELMVAPSRPTGAEVRSEQIQGICWRENQLHLLMEDVGHEKKMGLKLPRLLPEPPGWESFHLATRGRLWGGQVCGQVVGITSAPLRYQFKDAFCICEWRFHGCHWIYESGERPGPELLNSSTLFLNTCNLPLGQRFV